MNKHKLVGFLFLLGLTTFIAFQPLKARSPRETIRAEFDKIQALLGDTSYHKGKNIANLRKKIIDKMGPLFAFREMTLRALGPHARMATESQVKKMTKLFRELLKVMYVERLTGRLAETEKKFKLKKVEIIGEELKGQYARVKSVVYFELDEVQKNIPLNYSMVNRGDTWKIYDVHVQNISLISNYRSQFTEIINNISINGLIKNLKNRVKMLKNDPGE